MSKFTLKNKITGNFTKWGIGLLAATFSSYASAVTPNPDYMQPAQYITAYGASGGGGSYLDTFGFNDTFYSPTTIQKSGVAPSGSASAAVNLSIDEYGVSKVSLGAGAVTNYQMQSFSAAAASANVQFYDYLTFVGKPNSQARVQGSFVVDGKIDGSVVDLGGSAATYGGGVSFLDLPTNSWSQYTPAFGGDLRRSYASGEYLGRYLNGGDNYVTGDINGVVVPIDFTMNFDADGFAYQRFGYLLQFYVSVGADYIEKRDPYTNEIIDTMGGAAGASANFGHTMYWGGISSFMIDGVETSDYQIISSSGLDYKNSALSAAVPEPETYALMMVGLGLIGFTKRRKLQAPLV